MINLIYGHKDKIREWVCNELKLEKFGGDNYEAIGIMDDEELIGGFIYHHYVGHMVDISLATISKKWCTRRILREIFKYPFETCGVIRFQAQCKRSNKPMKKLFKRLGFKLEGVLRKAYRGTDDVFCYSMMKDECRWLK